MPDVAAFSTEDRPPLVGRDDELQLLLDAVAASHEGRPAVVLLGGDAGVGKTRLLAQVVAEAPAGTTVLRGGCVDLGDIGLPYLPFVEAFADLARQQPAAVDVPGLGPLLPGAAAQGGELVRLQLFEAVVAALRAAGEVAPVLLVLEDLHWADASSRELLRFLVTRLRDERVTLLASYRADDLHRRHPLVPLVGELGRLSGVEHLQLRPLDDAAVARHLSALVTLTPEVLSAVVRRAEGNAYFAEELALAAVDTGEDLPTRLSEVLLARLDRLAPETLSLVRLAAVAGRRVDHALLAAASAATGVDADPALREAVAAHVLSVVHETSFSFRHALMQETVYDDLLPGERVRLHGVLAQVLESLDGAAGELAHHKKRSGDLAGAYTDYLRAASAAMADGAPHEALAYREHALGLAASPAVAAGVEERVQLLHDTAESAGLAGDWSRAIALARESVALSASLDDARRSDAHRGLATHLLEGDREQEAIGEAAVAVELADRSGDVRRIARAQAQFAQAVLHELERDTDAAAAARIAYEAAVEAGLTDVQADALVTQGVLAEAEGDRPRAIALFRQARDLAVASGHLPQELRAAYNVAAHSFYAADLEAAEEAAVAAVQRAVEVGLAWSPYGYSVHGLLAVVRYTRGDLAGSTAVVAAAQGGSSDPARESLAGIGLYAAVARGDDGAVALARAITGSPQLDPLAWLVASGTGSDALRMAGELQAASELAQLGTARIAERWGEWSLGGIWLAALGIAAEADLATQARLRRDTEAERRHVERAQRWEQVAQETAIRGRPRGGVLGPEGGAWLLRCTAETRRAEGIADVPLWRGVVETFGYGYPYEEARARWRLAEALVAVGDRASAAEELQQALQVADALGTAPFREAVVDLARRARLDIGVRTAPVTVLTARELEVLRLVAAGSTNRQIGTQLFISEKTASVHVSRILAKLQVSGRTEAAARAAQLGLLT
ncbi:MAG: LuxR family transcriptional regulator [Frankiales bacterium]|nr:LuxR family transcriptional regulator [Frankiales bacterium]